MAKGIRYTKEFKRDAVSQVTDRGYSVADVANRLGVSTKSMYDWIKPPTLLIMNSAER